MLSNETVLKTMFHVSNVFLKKKNKTKKQS